MADRLTQLQDCYDQLATQFYASIRYISTHHSASALTPPPPSTSNNNAQPTTNNVTANHQPPPTQSTQSQEQPPTAQPSQPSQDPPEVDTVLFPEQCPDNPTTFAAAQRELAHDLMLKTQQIEYIISILPGVENSKEKQEERIRALDGELRAALEERKEAEWVREEWVRRVEGVVGGVRR